MFTITSKIRTLVALAAVGGVLASTGVASAATAVRSPGTVAPTASVQPTVVAKSLDPSKWGSANDNMTDGDCEQLATAVNNTNQEAAASADANMASHLADQASELQSQLEALCFQMD